MEGNKSEYINALYSPEKKSLYNFLWQPLKKELADIHTIYFSPSGLMHRVNTRAILDKKNQSLSEKYRLIQMNSTRQLALLHKKNIQTNNAMIYGGIQFEIDSNSYTGENMAAINKHSTYMEAELDFNENNLALRGGIWNALPCTEVEANSL